MIESLKKDKTELQSSLQTVSADQERLSKENSILRKAVQIQQERQNSAEAELKAAHEYRNSAQEQIRKLEQLVMQLRYHLQAQQAPANDFMNQRPPDVY